MMTSVPSPPPNTSDASTSPSPASQIFPKKKNPESIRLVTFNVNGVKTLFSYYPWNTLQQNYDKLFNEMNGDIITFQELKLSSQTLTSAGGNIGNLNEYRSFITIPKSKRGYSGVGVFVKKTIPVLKAEEGITGWLTSADDKTSTYRDRDPSKSIGGYPPTPETDVNGYSQERCLQLDGDGRCICLEIPGNIVIISVYCPANSLGSDAGEVFRLDFLRILLQRCYDLKHKHNKDVILMGDINVSIDLIDNAEGIQDRIKRKMVLPYHESSGEKFERIYFKQCIDFKSSKPSRKLLNKYVVPTINELESFLDEEDRKYQFLHDSTRAIQGRRMAMYTVWNTLTGARQSNYGSRIDLILTSSQDLKIDDADICPSINGSDHCPVYTDFLLPLPESSGDIEKVSLKFEARSFFKLVQHRDISMLFGRSIKGQTKEDEVKTESERESDNLTPTELFVSESTTIASPPKKRKIEYKSRKNGKKKASTLPSSQQSISNFFFKETSNVAEIPPESPAEEDCLGQNITTSQSPPPPSISKGQFSIASVSTLMYGKPPDCLHGEPCQLKTSLSNSKTRGKKFWCCPRTQIGLNSINRKEVGEHRCEFFEWAKPST